MLYLPEDSGYLVYKPFRYGRLNVQEANTPQGAAEGHSLTLVMNVLEDLWTKAIEEYLEIERKDFKVCTECCY